MYPLSKLKVDEWLKEEIYLPGGEDMRWIFIFYDTTIHKPLLFFQALPWI